MHERAPVAFVRLPRQHRESVSRLALIDRDGFILRPRVAAKFTLPVISGVKETETIENRKARVRCALGLLHDVGGFANQISEVDVADVNNIIVAEHVGNNVVNLILGGEKLSGPLRQLPRQLRRDPPQASRCHHVRPARGRRHHRTVGQSVLSNKSHNSRAKIAAGLDLGSSSTRLVICALDDHSVRFLGHGEAPVQAWNKGRIADPEALSGSIRFALNEAEERAQVSLESALVGVGGTVAGVNSRGLYEFGRRREIEAGDLRYAIELAARMRVDDERQVLQICPQDFTLDGRAGYRNPKGILGSRLEANVHIVTYALTEHQAIISAVHQAHLAVEETVFEGIAAAYACVIPEDRARGVALIDIGSQSTDVAVYDGDSLLIAISVPLGADHFTRDLSWLFKVSYDYAESLKREYGSAIASAAAGNSIVELPTPEGRGIREANCRQLNEVLEARAEELFERIYEEILRVGMEQSLLEGAVLTGGGAMLPGMCDVAERIMNCQARNGLAHGIENWPKDLDTPLWSTAAGLAMYSGRLKLKRDWKRAATAAAGSAAR